MTSSASPATWRTTTIRAGIAVYWLSMFLATHLPVQRVMEQLPTSDKHLHFGAYAVLGCALPWWSRERTRHWRSQWHPLLLYALLLSYAAADELLQIPVGRSAEWGDWWADAAGGLVGLVSATLTARLFAGVRPERSSPSETAP